MSNLTKKQIGTINTLLEKVSGLDILEYLNDIDEIDVHDVFHIHSPEMRDIDLIEKLEDMSESELENFSYKMTDELAQKIQRVLKQYHNI